MTTDFEQEQTHLTTIYQQLTATLAVINDAQSQNHQAGNTIKARSPAKLNSTLIHMPITSTPLPP